MKLYIEIEIDNDAFLYPGELERILQQVAEAAENTVGEKPATMIRDINGNTVGNWSIEA